MAASPPPLAISRIHRPAPTQNEKAGTRSGRAPALDSEPAKKIDDDRGAVPTGGDAAAVDAGSDQRQPDGAQQLGAAGTAHVGATWLGAQHDGADGAQQVAAAGAAQLGTAQLGPM